MLLLRWSKASRKRISDVELYQIKGTGKWSSNQKGYTQPSQVWSIQPLQPNTSSYYDTIASNIEKGEVRDMSRMEQLIAEHMHKSIQTSAHVQSYIEVDVTDLWDWREGIKQSFLQREGEKITFTPIFMMLTAQVLRDFPLLNSSLSGKKIIQKRKSIWVCNCARRWKSYCSSLKNADQLSLVGFTKSK